MVGNPELQERPWAEETCNRVSQAEGTANAKGRGGCLWNAGSLKEAGCLKQSEEGSVADVRDPGRVLGTGVT